MVLHGNATRQILSQERHHGCDLVVMGKHGTHVTEDLLLGSVTKRVLAESRSDVLVVPDERRPVSVFESAGESSSAGRD
jgi:CPA2 family monovalent cation:H+ antiporter-2